MGRLPIPFGNPATYKGHSGVDFPQRRGVLFRASGPGRVTNLGYGLRAGHTVWVQYDSGPLVMYAHLDTKSTRVRINDRVSEGSPLGDVGALGLNSTGPHLHVEISGHATTAGFWQFFDPTRVVGTPAPAGGGSSPPITPTESEEDEMTATYINIQGKAGSHRGGCFAIMRSNSGVLFARFVSPTPLAGVPTVPAEEYKAWTDTMPIK